LYLYDEEWFVSQTFFMIIIIVKLINNKVVNKTHFYDQYNSQICG